MQELTSEGRRRIDELARRYGTSPEASMTLLRALVAGGGTMAQFNHPDLGGMGQWSQGGMIMVGDMFNNALKAKVGGLCAELSGLLADQSNWEEPTGGQRSGGDPLENRQGSAGGIGEASLFIAGEAGRSTNWWGADLGHASSTGAQNATRYAYFPASHSLAIEIGGVVTLYDTGDHQIGGVSQQQSGDASLTFTSQHGLVRISDLPVVPASDAGRTSKEADKPTPAVTPVEARPSAERPGTVQENEEAPLAPYPPKSDPAAAGKHDIPTLIERLATLREKNILSEEEFSAKKAELLARL